MQPETSSSSHEAERVPPELQAADVVADLEAPEPQIPEEQAAKRTQLYFIAGGVGFLVFLILVIVLLAANPGPTEVIRDIAIVFVAVESFLIGLALIILLFQLQLLIQVLRDEIQPLLRSVNDTASTVRGTTEFVSHNVVSPVIKLAGFTAAVRRVTRDLTHVLRAARPRSRSTPQSKGGKEDVETG